jgi:hypothetical protein
MRTAPGSYQRTKERDSTLRGLVAELAERGLKVDYRSVWNFVHPEKLSYKKNRSGQRTRSARCRPQYQGRINPKRFIFIDEAWTKTTWTKTNMAPFRGWAQRGVRQTAKVPHGRRKTTSSPPCATIGLALHGFSMARSTARA